MLDRAAEHGLRNPQYEKEHSLLTRDLTVNVHLHRSDNMVQQVRSVVTCAKNIVLKPDFNWFSCSLPLLMNTVDP